MKAHFTCRLSRSTPFFLAEVPRLLEFSDATLQAQDLLSLGLQMVRAIRDREMHFGEFFNCLRQL
jgi:hypothetical protein